MFNLKGFSTRRGRLAPTDMHRILVLHGCSGWGAGVLASVFSIDITASGIFDTQLMIGNLSCCQCGV